MSIPARADRRPNGLQSDAKVGGMSGADELKPARRDAYVCRKACPVYPLRNGMYFPLAGPTGKRIPQFRVIPGCAFPNAPEAESASHSGSKFRDAVSAKPPVKEKDPFAEVLVNSRWRGRESRPRSARADRCGASAPCELRWQTLSRFLSSAPSRGSIPCGGYIKEKDPFAEVLVNSRWRGRESNP